MIVCEQTSLIATDVKVAPGGTENVDTEIYEAVVSQPITEPQVSPQSSPLCDPSSSFLYPVVDPAGSVCSLVGVSTLGRST